MAEIKIAGTLHNTEEIQGDALHSHVVAEASEILDTTRGKKQSEFNAAVHDDLTGANGLQGRVATLEAQVAFDGDFQAENTAEGITTGSGKIVTANAARGAIDVRTGYFVCDTTAATAAKAVTAGGFVLTGGGAIKIKMTNANTAASGVTLNINSTGAKTIYYNGEAVNASNTWEAGEVVEVYYDPSANSNVGAYYANNVAGGAGDGVFDLTAKTGDTYATLGAALTAANTAIPANKKKGGMSIKYVQTYDNKYSQYILMADEFTTDTTQWAIAEEGVYVENSEFIYVKTDNKDKILWAIKTDGTIYYGAGVPQQVIDYIEKKISNLPLDEYEDIVTFLGNLIDGGTLSELLYEKVDKEEGKGLSTNDYTDSEKYVVGTMSVVDNPEFTEVTTDSEDHVLEGIKTNGTKVFYNNIEIKGNVNIGDSGIYNEDNPEFIDVEIDNKDRILSARRTNGNKVELFDVEYPNGIPTAIQEQINGVQEQIENSTIPIFENDSELNVYRKIQQLANLKWTPKGRVIHISGTQYPIGIEVTGIPYSSAKEYMKFVGLDVSIHTFMTAANDEHSLLYTEVIDKDISESAYGRTYKGVNGFSYFGTVCSGFVSTALGLRYQNDSWEFRSLLDKYEILPNQDARSLKIGDVIAEPGHAEIITEIKRNKYGAVENITRSEIGYTIEIRSKTPNEINEFRAKKDGVWCRYKELFNNVDYKPIPFVLLKEDGYLYWLEDYMFIEDDNTKTYYKCEVPNSDVSFDPSKWKVINAYTIGKTYSLAEKMVYDNTLYQCNTKNYVAESTFDATKWYRVRGVFEWAAYPFNYNNDICTFAGDRAAFKTNDLIYINYAKGTYTQMQLYKDEALIQTYNLPTLGYQINVSSECSGAGLYKARLTDGTHYSRCTYFEVIDTQVSITAENGVLDVTFGSSNGKALYAQACQLSGYPICRIDLNDDDVKNGTINFDVAARLYVEKAHEWTRTSGDVSGTLYGRVIFAGEYGNVASDMISIGTVTYIDGIIVYPDNFVDLGIINGNKNLILGDKLVGNVYIANFTAGSSASINVISGIGTVEWVTNPTDLTLTENKNYQIKVENGIGNIIEL